MMNTVNKITQLRVVPLILLLSLFLSTSCSPSIAPFSETAYQQAIEMKVEAMELMPKATEPFEDYESEVAELRHGLNVAYEYADGRPDNEISARQWDIMIDPGRNMLGGFLSRWEDEGSLNEVFIQEAQKLVREGFDTIIGLESGKIDPDEV